MGLAGGAGRKLDTMSTFTSWTSFAWERERGTKGRGFEEEDKISGFRQVESELSKGPAWRTDWQVVLNLERSTFQRGIWKSGR